MKNNLPLFEAVAIIVGTIIGAGIVGIPYVFAKSGFLTGALVLVLVSIALLLARLMLGEVVMRTSKEFQLTGYTEHYLGRSLKNIQGFVLIISLLGTLLAYIIGQGDVLSALFGGSGFNWSIGFYLVFSFLVIMGINAVKRSELFMIVALFFVISVIAVITAPDIQFTLLNDIDISNILMPFGVVLFASAGLVSVPQAWTVLKNNKKGSLKKAIWIGSLIPFFVYLIFAALVVGITGSSTTEVATVGLGQAIGPHMIIIGNVFSFFAIATSFLTLALALTDILIHDYRIPRPVASGLVLIVPLLMFAVGLRDFILIISVVGSLTVGINGLLSIGLYWKARKNGDQEPEYAISPKFALPASIFLGVVFTAGLVAVFFT